MKILPCAKHSESAWKASKERVAKRSRPWRKKEGRAEKKEREGKEREGKGREGEKKGKGGRKEKERHCIALATKPSRRLEPGPRRPCLGAVAMARAHGPGNDQQQRCQQRHQRRQRRPSPQTAGAQQREAAHVEQSQQRQPHQGVGPDRWPQLGAQPLAGHDGGGLILSWAVAFVRIR